MPMTPWGSPMKQSDAHVQSGKRKSSRRIKIYGWALVAALLGLAAFMAPAGRDLLLVATNSVSRSLCASAFVSRVDPARVFKDEQLPSMRSLGWAMRFHLDPDQREVRTDLLGAFAARAVYREGLGCVLVHGDGAVPDAGGIKPEDDIAVAGEPAL